MLYITILLFVLFVLMDLGVLMGKCMAHYNGQTIVSPTSALLAI